MATASAPGKVYLFGEHAVVYGEPAVPCAVGRRARVTVERREDGLRVSLPDLSPGGVTVDDADERVETADQRVETAVEYVTTAVDSARERARADGVGATPGLGITVESDIPPGAGLGSSAAVVVATLAAAAREFGVDPTPSAVADRAYRVERAVQGEASRADTFCSTVGGAVRVEGDDCRRLDAPGLPLVVGYDGDSGETGALVSAVRTLREEYEFAADTVAAIGSLSRRGERALAAGDHERVGQLMNSNHGLLSALGVSTRSLDAMVWAARDAGARGAKLTGAGGGGCIVALDETPAAVTALEQTADCQQAFRAELDTEGLRVEE